MTNGKYKNKETNNKKLKNTNPQTLRKQEMKEAEEGLCKKIRN